MNIHILFLGGSKRVSVAELFIQAGEALNSTVKIFSYELDGDEPIAKIGNIIKGLKWNDKAILQDIKKTIADNNINIVVPFVDIATILCATLQFELSGIFFCVSSQEICKIMFDKKKSHEWFTAHNFLVPSIEIKLPLIAKLLTGSGAKGLKFLHSQAQLNLFLMEENTANYLFQEIIVGDEFSVDCYVDTKGRIVSVVPRKRIEVVNGEVTRSKTVKDDEVIQKSTAILKTVGFAGPVTIQFIREKKNGKLYLIEINPRFGSGVLTSIKAGADICKFILNDFLNIDNELAINWKENLLMVRAFKEYYFDATDN